MSPAALSQVLVLGVPVFASTNIDDILLLAMFFASGRGSARAIVGGQLLGIGALVAASAAAAALSLAMPLGWTGLLGLLPLGLGVRALIERSRGGDEEDGPPEAPAALSALVVAAVTVANGGDNLGVYIPLFARDTALVPAYTLLFGALTLLWCGLGYWSVSHPALGERLRRGGEALLAWVLCGLGVYLLSGLRALA